MPTRAETMEYLTKALTALFPDNGVRVIERCLIGESTLHVYYTHFKTAAECKSQILENDPAYMHFFLQRYHNTTYFIEFPFTHCSRVLQKGGPITFRKIKGNSEHEIAEKLVAWFTKNAEAIRAVTAN